jgi:hypothetical protein
MKFFVQYCLALAFFTSISCKPYPEGYFDRLDEFEKNWRYCYDNRFLFDNEPSSSENEVISGIINGKEFLLHSKPSGFEGTTLFSFSGTSTASTINLSKQKGQTQRVHISFVDFEYFKELGIIIEYEEKLLNQTIQKLFSNPYITCASNFQKGLPCFQIGTYCTPDGRINFSTLYSLIPEQKITIKDFSYKLYNGIWQYHLEYLITEMKLTNEIWNSSSKIDINGRERYSDKLIEDIIVSDIHAIINFELAED